MREPFDVSERRVLVTGGTRGIGRAISLRLARAGATVTANYVRNKQAAEALTAEAENEGLNLKTCQADVTTRKGLDIVKESMQEPGDSATVLVHCAATGIHRPFEALTGRHYEWTFALNVRAFLELVQTLLPGMKEGSSILAVCFRSCRMTG